MENIFSKILKSAPVCDKEESDKINKALSSLTSEDLEIAETHHLITIDEEKKYEQ